jgi:hypothetical protein
MGDNEIRLDSTTDSLSDVQAALDGVQNTEPRLGDQVERPPRRNGNGFKKRIDRLTAIRKQQEVEIYERDREIERLRHYEPRESTVTEVASENAEEPRPTEQQQPVETEPRPARETAQAAQGQPTDQANERFNAEAQYRAQTSKQRFRDAIAKYGPEFRQAILDAPPVPKPIIDVIPFLTNAPETAHYLATHRPIVESLFKMSPNDAVQKVIRISHAIELQQEDGSWKLGRPSEPIRTKAPRPITPIGSTGGAATVDVSDPNISTEAYYAARSAQLRRR